MIDHRGELYDFRDKLNEVGCGFVCKKKNGHKLQFTYKMVKLLDTIQTPHKIPLIELRRTHLLYTILNTRKDREEPC